MDVDPASQVVSRRLFDSALLRVGHVVARASSPACGEVECQSVNLLVLPTAGVFAKHDGPRRHVIATSNHAVFIAADQPYRLSFPACIGDQSLVIQLTSAQLARAMPQAMGRDGFDASAFASRALLAPSLMLARSLLLRRLQRGDVDPLQVEELGIALLAGALSAAHKGTARRSRAVRSNSVHRWRQVERVKEAIATCPARKWTLGNLADAACVSPFHLAHLFREEVGVSVYGFVLRARLATALLGVLESDADLATVALEAGFASHSHFTARFRAFFGLTPTELRRGAGPREIAQLRRIVTAGAAVAA